MTQISASVCSLCVDIFHEYRITVCLILAYKLSSMPFLKLFLLPILFALGSTPISVNQQSTNSNSKQEMFNYLRCHRQAKNIVVNWGMTSQLGVTRYIVYHSEDGEFFDPIAEITADDVSSKYSFKHMD